MEFCASIAHDTFQQRRGRMIEVTRINGTKIMINSDIIEMMEETPDTVITLTNGHKYIVSEKTDQIKESIISFRREIYKDLIAVDKN